eukprot:scaffold360_cov374-Pavlova_lutheri.AAC.18
MEKRECGDNLGEGKEDKDRGKGSKIGRAMMRKVADRGRLYNPPEQRSNSYPCMEHVWGSTRKMF